MIRGLVGICVAAAIVIGGLSVYLGPDGMKSCGQSPDQVAFDCQKVDAIVAISGGDTSARTAQAIELYKNGWADKLILSGAAADKTGPSNAEAMRRQAINEGVSPSSIILEETSETTKQNAANTHDLFTNNDITSVILVTSAYHQRRAGLEFGQRAGTNIRIVNHPVASDNQWSPWWWTTPGGWFLALGEFFKIIIFYLGGSR
ncbi:YdcF family protein [Candidatus Saccharibacteria bacterium]|nr:YdcF family protein [Candidatus Saccharibacteria bacterium]